MKKTLQTALVAVALPSLALTACGSDDDVDSPDDPVEVDDGSGDDGGETDPAGDPADGSTDEPADDDQMDGEGEDG